jgi:trimeric autotransporter adhesin
MKKLFFTLLAFISLFGQTMAQKAFTKGNIVVCRIGNGTEALAATDNHVFIDEYNVSTTPATLVQSVAVTSGSDNLTMGGTLTYGGYLARSYDSLSLAMAGYTTTVPTIAVVDANGGVDLTTKLTSLTELPRGAVSSNGTDLWLTTATTDFKGGLYYTTKGSATTTAINSAAYKKFNFGSIKINSYYGRLVTVTEFKDNNTISKRFTYGTTTSPLPKTIVSTPSYTYSFTKIKQLYDIIEGPLKTAGSSYLLEGYATDVTNIGIAKNYISNSTYPGTLMGCIAGGDSAWYGICETQLTDESVIFYATRYNKTTSGCELVRVADIGGFANAPDATIEVLASAPAGTIFRGVAQAPIAGINPPTAINNAVTPAPTLKLTPNPITNNSANLTFAEAGDNAIIRIVSLTGKTVIQQQVAKGSTQASIDVSNFAKGVYLVNYSDDAFKNRTVKLIK